MKTNIMRLMESFPEDIDGVLITSSPNQYYFMNYSSSDGVLLVTRKGGYFFTDFRFIEAAKNKARNCDVYLKNYFGQQLSTLLLEQNIKTLAIETSYLTCRSYCDLKELIQPVKLCSDNRVNDIILKQRQIKNESELQHLRTAQEMTDEAFLHILNFIRPGKSELELVMELGTHMAKQGSENHSFQFIFCTGANTSLPHGGGAERVVQHGDFVMMDFGAAVNGYSADMTRTVAVGNITGEQRQAYQTVLNAQMLALEAIAPNRICSDIDRIARDYIDQAGYQNAFGHGLGHSLGLEIHENPKFNSTCQDPLQSGMVMTIEPGIYLEGRFGVRIEDMVIITDNGCENLTTSKKELILL